MSTALRAEAEEGEAAQRQGGIDGEDAAGEEAGEEQPEIEAGADQQRPGHHVEQEPGGALEGRHLADVRLQPMGIGAADRRGIRPVERQQHEDPQRIERGGEAQHLAEPADAGTQGLDGGAGGGVDHRDLLGDVSI